MFCTISQRLSLRCMSIRQEDTLPDLPYDFDELEPVISAEINRKGELLEAINKDYYGSLENMKNIFSSATVAIQGSGWGWLYNKTTIKTPPPPLPLLGIDVWKHVYYAQYKNVCADYVKNLFKIINRWEDMSATCQKFDSGLQIDVLK
ncbi:superoxide dismutase [Mn], mitochondrial-like [Daphnia magna]|uniref:superoxide dismutase [Mn], mitochondrial-like n=1 Tax=Daphnia magna TaxID=35525 RepID=UPI001E1BD37E|nr:superoxide dismutase [Mn], mitochondrial-like [Daphnia magna]